MGRRPLSKGISEEVERVVDSYRHPRTGEPMSAQTKKRWISAIRLFIEEIARQHPTRILNSLSDFQTEDLENYRVSIEGNQNRILKGTTISTRLMALKGVFKAAYVQRVIPLNIAEDFRPPRVVSPDLYRRLQPEEIDRLCAIDEKELERLDTREKFLYLRDVAMVATQKDAALRASEVIRLSDADILWERHSAGRHVPIIIRESKGRIRGEEDVTYLSAWGAQYIVRYLQAREEYFKAAGLISETVHSAKSDRPIGPALFCTEKGSPMVSPFFYERSIFRKLAERAGLSKSYTTHYLRHTRITEWVESGMDPKRVQRLARHKDVQMTLRYYHFSEKELVADLDKRFGSEKPEAAVKPELLPEKAMRLALFRHALSTFGQNADEATLEHLDAIFQRDLKTVLAEVYYSVQETCEKLRIKRTQLYVGWIRSGHLHPFKLGGHTVFLKGEVEDLASLRTTEEASRILGYKEKVPVTVARLAARGKLRGFKIGRGWRFHDRDLAEHLLDKQLGRFYFGI